MKAPVTREKAKKMMHEGTVRGHPMTEKQMGMFGAIAGGNFKGPRSPRNPTRSPHAKG